MGRVFNFRCGCMHTMHILPSVAIQPNLELKTQPTQLLGFLPLVIVLPGSANNENSPLHSPHFTKINDDIIVKLLSHF
jgi:hypothetical protein